MDDTNPEVIVEQQVDQVSDDSQQVKDDNTDGNVADTGGDGSQEDNFLNQEDQKNLGDYLEQHPELKPYKDHVYKQMQSGFTKAMQGIPKQYRGEKFKELMQKAEFSDAINKDPKLVALLDGYYKGGNKQDTNAPEKESKQDASPETGDDITKMLEDATDEEKAFYSRWRKVFENIADSKMKPISSKVDTYEERSALGEMTEAYPDIDVKSYWDDVKDNRTKYKLGWKEALKLAIADDMPNFYRGLGKDEAAKVSTDAKKAGVVVGASTGTKTKGSQVKADADMTAEEFRKAHGLPEHEV